MRVLTDTRVEFRSPSGAVVAHISIVPMKDEPNASTAPLTQTDEEDAREHGETTVQLRESERYEYEVVRTSDSDLRLRCSLSERRRSLGTDGGKPDAGLIETRSFCGTLLLELVEGVVDHEKPAVASALLDVRSLKLRYRTEYRGMLRRLSQEIADLVVDARSSAKGGFLSTGTNRADAGWLQIQLELLRETIESADFSAALQRILSFPHERLSTVSDSISTDRPIRWTPSAVRQLVTSNPRRQVPVSHPLRTQLGLESLAKRVLVLRKSRDLDTIENRFVKFALGEFRAFLTHAQGVFESTAGWGASATLTRRLTAIVEDWLGRSLFREVGEMNFAPLGSPVLQRKAGYRDVLRWWLRFHTASQLSWKGGEEMFHVGQRDVASLYEYWLFFELLGWFCKKCCGGVRPAIEELIEGLDSGSPNLRLKQRMELGPFVGKFAGSSRRLNAHFSYNRCFPMTSDRHKSGSWTRRLHPDYTLTFWPEELSQDDAENQELLVHLHFDAKYRVEKIEDLFGSEEADSEDDDEDELDGNYKRQDLLKMHAYRDAIKRSQGAYVLYPGRSATGKKFRTFHEILPGLGAFGITPDENGVAQGFESLKNFLDEVLSQLSNRTTAQERVSYHVAESYMQKKEPVQYGSLVLDERDVLDKSKRALPPAEHFVMVAWYESPEQLVWIKKNGLALVELSRASVMRPIPLEISSARHVLFFCSGSPEPAEGLFRLTKSGYLILTGSEIKAKGFPVSSAADLYAGFEVISDNAYEGRKWNQDEVAASSNSWGRQRLPNENFRDPPSFDAKMVKAISLQELLRVMRG